MWACIPYWFIPWSLASPVPSVYIIPFKNLTYNHIDLLPASFQPLLRFENPLSLPLKDWASVPPEQSQWLRGKSFPSRTPITHGKKQWAAVRAHWWWIRVPKQGSCSDFRKIKKVGAVLMLNWLNCWANFFCAGIGVTFVAVIAARLEKEGENIRDRDKHSRGQIWDILCGSVLKLSMCSWCLRYY